MREICTSGSVRGGGGNVPTYSAARIAQQSGDPSIPIAALSLGQLDDVGGQCHLIIGCLQRLALGGTVLPQNLAGPAFRDAQLAPHRLHTCAAAGGA
jgi:hypothetical protein